MKTTYTTTIYDLTVSVTADWAQASCQITGDLPGGRQVADFSHSGKAALHAAVCAVLMAGGDVPDTDGAWDGDVADRIDSAMRRVTTSM